MLGLLRLFLIYLAIVNVITFLVFAWDKFAAKTERGRVRETTLLGSAALGGTPAALLARTVFRHKTQKQPFSSVLMGILAVQILLLIAFISWRVLGQI